jgi:hypothetical protein
MLMSQLRVVVVRREKGEDVAEAEHSSGKQKRGEPLLKPPTNEG